MRFGYLRKDGDGHAYLVPEEEIVAFDRAMEHGYETDDWELFNDNFWKYVLGGSYYDLKVVIEE